MSNLKPNDLAFLEKEFKALLKQHEPELIKLGDASEKLKLAIKTLEPFDFNTYQREAAKTLPADADLIRKLRIGAYNLWEAGEIGNLIKKLDEHGWELDIPRSRLDFKTPREAILDEAGDLLWALTTIVTAVGGDLAKVAEGNISKLREIHGESFNAAAVKERGR